MKLRLQGHFSSRLRTTTQQQSLEDRSHQTSQGSSENRATLLLSSVPSEQGIGGPRQINEHTEHEKDTKFLLFQDHTTSYVQNLL